MKHVIYSKVLSQHLPRGNEETDEKFSLDIQPLGQEMKPEPPRYYVIVPSTQLHCSIAHLCFNNYVLKKLRVPREADKMGLFLGLKYVI
jgi:membrane associated rhomboid family serine protease